MSNVHLNLEFAPNARKTSLAGLALLAVAVLLFAIAAMQVGRQVSENAAKSQNIAELDVKRRAPLPPPPKPSRADPAEAARAQFVRQTSRSLMTPWADLFAALEAAPSNVALLSVEPSAAKRSFSMTAEAASPVQMLNYLQALQNDSRLAGVTLVSHQVQLQAPGTPMRFQLRANWGEAP
jgi:hypothetical protein